MKGTFTRPRGEQLKVAKDSAVKARTQAISQLRKARRLPPRRPGARTSDALGKDFVRARRASMRELHVPRVRAQVPLIRLARLGVPGNGPG
jgi:hypothetical protein